MQNILLAFCEKLVLNELSQKKALNPVPDQMYYMRTLATLQAEKEQALTGFSRLAFEVKNESKIQWTIQNCQEKIVMLSDHVTRDMANKDILTAGTEDDPVASWTALSKSILRTLLELLNQLEYRFGKYIEPNGRIPIAYLVAARYRFDNRLAILTAALASAGVSGQLQAFIQQPFRELLCEDDGQIITYQRLFYLNSLMLELSTIVPVSQEAENIDAMIQGKLRDMNYNHPDFYAYCTACIDNEVKFLPPAERLECLIWTLKEVNQIQHKYGMIFNPLNDSLKQQLQMWLTEEINYLKAVGEIPATGDAVPARWKGFKVETQFSVAQMAYCIKLLCDTGIFTNPNKTELLDFFSEFFTSVKQPKISSRSLRKNFYNDDASAAAGVREILITLLNQSRKGLTSWMIGVASFCEFIFHVVYVNQ